MVKELREKINQLSESEAKNFLFHMVLHLKDMQGSDQENVDKLLQWFERFIKISEEQKVEKFDYKAVHIVCGEASAGSLKVGLGPKNKVISFPDLFAVGPLEELHKRSGLIQRFEWLRDHLNVEDDFLEDEYQKRFEKATAEIEKIPVHIPVVLWAGENADEQIGIRFILYLLREKKNDLYLINPTLAYQKLFNTEDTQYFYSHTGSVAPEELKIIYQNYLTKPINMEERQRFEKEWMSLAKTKRFLRIWENNLIQEVKEEYFDELIMTAVHAAHAEQQKKAFIRAPRIIGEVLGQLDGQVGDVFLEYRLRHLINQGALEIKGVPKAMRHYSVKVKD